MSTAGLAPVIRLAPRRSAREVIKVLRALPLFPNTSTLRTVSRGAGADIATPVVGEVLRDLIEFGAVVRVVRAGFGTRYGLSKLGAEWLAGNTSLVFPTQNGRNYVWQLV